MAEAITGEIRMFAGTFAPRLWAFCDGAILPTSGNEALFSLIRNRYGGDGISNFALPDLRGRVPIHYGTGAGLTPRLLGEKIGIERVQLSTQEIPLHDHRMQATIKPGTTQSPEDAILADPATTVYVYHESSLNTVPYLEQAVGNKGESDAHNNMQPFLCVSFIICLAGDYPARN